MASPVKKGSTIGGPVAGLRALARDLDVGRAAVPLAEGGSPSSVHRAPRDLSPNSLQGRIPREPVPAYKDGRARPLRLLRPPSRGIPTSHFDDHRVERRARPRTGRQPAGGVPMGPGVRTGTSRTIRRSNEEREPAVSSWKGGETARAPSLARLRAGRGRGGLLCQWAETLGFRTAGRPPSEPDSHRGEPRAVGGSIPPKKGPGRGGHARVLDPGPRERPTFPRCDTPSGR